MKIELLMTFLKENFLKRSYVTRVDNRLSENLQGDAHRRLLPGQGLCVNLFLNPVVRARIGIFSGIAIYIFSLSCFSIHFPTILKPLVSVP